MPSLLHYDDEGNTWTDEQVAEAARSKVADESGEGTFGGLNEDDNLNPTPTTPPTNPNADVDALVSRSKGAEAAPQRELNPTHFGDFFKSNIFGGLNGKYITGKRPMTAFDYATDALAAYGGEDLGKRNAEIIKANKGDTLTGLTAEKLGQEIKTGRANEQRAQAATGKTGLETRKMLDEVFGHVFENMDSDLWREEVQHIAKQNGIELSPAQFKMVDRGMQAMKDAGVTSVHDVLSNKEKYDPALYSRVLHLNNFLTKSIEESQGRQAMTEQRNAAAGAGTARVGQANDRIKQRGATILANPNTQAAVGAGIIKEGDIPGAGALPTPEQRDKAAGERNRMKPLSQEEATTRRQLQITRTSYDRIQGILGRIRDAGGPLGGRVNLAKYKAGISNAKREIDSLIGNLQVFEVQGVRPFTQGMGRPAFEFLQQVQAHFPKTYDDLNLMRDKLNTVVGPQLDAVERAYNDTLGLTRGSGNVETHGEPGEAPQPGRETDKRALAQAWSDRIKAAPPEKRAALAEEAKRDLAR